MKKYNFHWSPAPSAPLTEGKQVHVWMAPLNVDRIEEISYKAQLSQNEANRALRFRYNQDRIRYIAAHGVLRKLLSKYLECPTAEIKFEYGQQGKPKLSGDSDLQFNISHAGDLGLFGFSRNLEIGIDIEQIRPRIDLEDISRRFFSPAEEAALFELPSEERLCAFYTCWTRKEAFIKAIGKGLSTPLDQFEVSLKPDEPARLNAIHWDEQEALNWSLCALDVPTGYVGAVAVRGQNLAIECINWSES